VPEQPFLQGTEAAKGATLFPSNHDHYDFCFHISFGIFYNALLACRQNEQASRASGSKKKFSQGNAPKHGLKPDSDIRCPSVYLSGFQPVTFFSFPDKNSITLPVILNCYATLKAETPPKHTTDPCLWV
jgi:hypothetical protein